MYCDTPQTPNCQRSFPKNKKEETAFLMAVSSIEKRRENEARNETAYYIMGLPPLNFGCTCPSHNEDHIFIAVRFIALI